ncbi:MAG: TetR/AcrR family transcriptional regulator [Sneathiella sp.]|nr:TetR/AcrR family transcriptional regulator [Sneathiella sp.]
MSEVEIRKARKNPERRSDSNQRIIQAAMELFAEKGYQRTTLIQIGQRAGFTGTLVSNRFGNKERVLRAVLAHILNRFEGGEGAVEAEGQALSSADRLKSFVRMYLEDVAMQGARIRALYVIMGEALGALPEISEEVIKVNTVFRGEIKTLIKDGMNTGEFNQRLDLELTSALVVGLLRGIAMQILVEPDRLELKKLIQSSQRSINHMVGA